MRLGFSRQTLGKLNRQTRQDSSENQEPEVPPELPNLETHSELQLMFQAVSELFPLRMVAMIEMCRAAAKLEPSFEEKGALEPLAWRNAGV